MDDAPGLATIPGRLAPARPGAAAARRNPFARCEVFNDLAPARAAWREIEELAAASPYQGFAFADAWFAASGRARGVEPLIVVARDDAGRVNAVLPLGRRKRGPVWTAEFIGSADANFKMGLFRPTLGADRKSIETLLQRAAQLTKQRIDVFWLTDQPHSWRGAGNPMASLPHAPSPSFGHKTALHADFAAWMRSHYSKEAQRKLRKKTRRLQEMGPLSHVVATDEAGAREILAAFLRQKARRMRALQLTNVYADAHTTRFFEIAATQGFATGAPTIELHALVSGERIVATLGGLARSGRFCGMFLSYDADPTISRCSPGQLLVVETIRDLAARGFATFDLGVGEARYKDENCEVDEPLFDAVIAVTAAGALFAAGARLQRRVKRWTKQTPWARALADGLRRRVFLLRGKGRAGASS